MNQEENSLNESSFDFNKIKRTSFLTFICILSFINNGWGVINNSIYSFFHTTISDVLSKTEFPKEWEVFSEAMLKLLSAGRLFFVVGLILSLTTLLGVFKMWKLQKLGFHIYSISQLVSLIYPMFFLKDFPVPIYSFLLTGGFIAMFATQLKIMR